MRKNLFLAIAALVVVISTMTITLATGQTIQFVDNLNIDTSSLVEITIPRTIVDSISDQSLSFESAGWQFTAADNRPCLEQSHGYSCGQCWESTTNQIMGQFSGATFTPNDLWKLWVKQTATATEPVTLTCPVHLTNSAAPTDLTVSIKSGTTSVGTFTLAAPPAFVTPELSISTDPTLSPIGNKDEKKHPYGTTALEFGFKANLPGPYKVSLASASTGNNNNNNIVAPEPTLRNNVDGSSAPWYCQVDGKDYARIQFVRGDNNNENDHVVVHIPSNHSSAKEVKCKLLLDNDTNNRHRTQQQQAQTIINLIISFGRSTHTDTKQLPEWPKTDLMFFASLNLDEDSNPAEIEITSTNFYLSNGPQLDADSKIVFKFETEGGIDLSKIKYDGQNDSWNQPRKSFCDDLYSSKPIISGNTIILEKVDVSSDFHRLKCDFTWDRARDLYRSLGGTGTISISVGVNGKQIQTTMGTNKADMYLGGLREDSTLPNSKLRLQEKGLVANQPSDTARAKYFVSYKLTSPTNLTVQPNRPRFAIAFVRSIPYNMDELAKAMVCKVGSEAMKLDFDNERLVWLGDLGQWVKSEQYTVDIVCEFTVDKVMKWGVDITPDFAVQAIVFELLVGEQRFFGKAMVSSQPANFQTHTNLNQTGIIYPTEPIAALIKLSHDMILPSPLDNDKITAAAEAHKNAGIDGLQTLNPGAGWLFNYIGSNTLEEGASDSTDSMSSGDSSDDYRNKNNNNTDNCVPRGFGMREDRQPRNYFNIDQAEPAFNFLYNKQTDKIKSVILPGLPIYRNTRDGRDLEYWFSKSFISTKIKSYFCATNTETPTTPVTPGKTSDYEWTFVQNKYQTDPILANFGLTTKLEDSTLVSGGLGENTCGSEHTFLTWPLKHNDNNRKASMGYSFANGSGTNAFDIFKDGFEKRCYIKCRDGQSCKKNHDCSSLYCSGGKCGKPIVAPITKKAGFIMEVNQPPLASQATPFAQAFFKSGSMPATTVSAAMMMTIVVAISAMF